MRKLLHRLRGTPGNAPEKSPAPGHSSPPTTPPAGAPLAAYADFIAGGALIVAFRRAPGRLALRTAPDGDLIPLPAELREEQHDLVSAHVDLVDVDALPAGEPWIYDVVLVDDQGHAHHLWLTPAKLPTIPLPVDGRQFRVRRGPLGFLKVQHTPLRAAVELLRIGGDDDTIDLMLPAGAEGHLLLLENDEVLATVPLRRENDESIATLSIDGMPADDFEVATVAVGTPQEWRPVRRRQNAMADPRGAVPMPELFGDDSDVPALRLQFTLDAELVAKGPGAPVDTGKDSS